jgi:hypothetical protein
VPKLNAKNNFIPFIIVIILLFLLIQAASCQQRVGSRNHAELVDTDNYMRLVRVEQLAESGSWYDSVIHRSNYPYGEELHWTRFLDVLLLGGAYMLSPFLGFKQGLLAWGIIFSPLLGLCSLLALFWATRPVMSANSQRLLCLLFISHSLLMSVFLFGRPDHHSLLLLLFIVLLGCLFRSVEQPVNNIYILLTGFIAALSLWVSVETVFAIIMVYITLGILWLTREKAFARQLLLFSLSIFLFSTVFLLIERPPSHWFAAEYDKISVAHLFVFLLAVLATYLLTLIRSSRLCHKLIKSASILIASGFAIWLVYPAFYQGPMAGINRDIVLIWLSGVSEVQPLWSLEQYDQVIIIGSIVLFFIYLSYLVFKKRFADNLPLFMPLVCGFSIFLPLGIYQIRMDYYLLVLIIILLAVFLDDIIAFISKSNISNYLKPLLRITVILLFILGLPVIGLFASLDNATKVETTNPELLTLSIFLNEYRQTDPDAQTILTYLDFGPELLYRTDFNLISTPYHRNEQGILYNYQVMAAESFEDAQEMLEGRSVDLLLLCPKSAETNYYKKTADQSTFYERLTADEIPAFLEEVVLPTPLEESFRMYRIIS